MPQPEIVEIEMPVFKVLKRVDAFVIYVALVAADDAEDAANTAYEGLVDIEWKEVDVDEFDDHGVVTLDAEDNEMEQTRRGDF